MTIKYAKSISLAAPASAADELRERIYRKMTEVIDWVNYGTDNKIADMRRLIEFERQHEMALIAYHRKVIALRNALDNLNL